MSEEEKKDVKKYYWLKLKENFFEDDTISWLEEQTNGTEYVNFYLKLALKSLNANGKLIRYVGETLIPYDTEALSKLTNTKVDTVAVAMKTFIKIGLIEILDTGEIYLKQINEMIGKETQYAIQKRRQRVINNNKNLLGGQCPDNVKKCPVEIEIEKELDIELEKEIDIPILILGEYENVKLTEFEYEMLVLEYRKKATDEIIEELSSGIKSKGYKYKDHNATIRNWLRRKGVEKCQEVDKTKMKKIYLENMEQKKKQVGETELKN